MHAPTTMDVTLSSLVRRSGIKFDPFEFKIEIMSHSVPPRRGQRVKSLILPPFNGGNAFQVVALEDGRFGIVDRAISRTQTRIWIEYDLIPTVCDAASLTAVRLPTVPAAAYEEVGATIGGIGKHLRWHVLFPNKKYKGSAVLHVSGIRDTIQFQTFVENVVRPFGLCRYEYVDDTTKVTVPDAQRIALVAAALHCAGYKAVPEDPKSVSGAKLAIERYDRSEHMWWNQAQDNAGPLRDVHRWAFDFLPPEWTAIPFTWQAMCRNIALDPVNESQHLPLPLRDFYLSMHIHKGEAAGTDVQPLHQRRGRPSVTCRLSPDQNRQLLAACFWTIIAPFDATAVRVGRLLRFRLMLHGYTGREIGGYNQTAQHLGHGAQIRTFRNKPQYKPENLSTRMLNQIYHADGTMRGTGFKGTRGKYGHRDFPQYKPAKRMKRSATQESKMRDPAQNVFEAYHQRKPESD